MPLMMLSFQVGDVAALLRREVEGTALSGATAGELAAAWAAKAAHLGLILGAPCLLHGWRQGLAAACVYGATQGVLLGALFAVSHNVPGTKAPAGAGDSSSNGAASVASRAADAHDCTTLTAAGAHDGDPAASATCPFCAPLEDWAVQQLQTSADWGGRWAGVVTGGLNFQAAHHLFPTLPCSLLPAATAVIRDEARAAGLRYTAYPSLGAILRDFLGFLRTVGRQA